MAQSTRAPGPLSRGQRFDSRRRQDFFLIEDELSLTLVLSLNSTKLLRENLDVNSYHKKIKSRN